MVLRVPIGNCKRESLIRNVVKKISIEYPKFMPDVGFRELRFSRAYLFGHLSITIKFKLIDDHLKVWTEEEIEGIVTGVERRHIDSVLRLVAIIIKNITKKCCK